MVEINIKLPKLIMKNMAKVIVGKNKPLELLLVALLAKGHALLEDMPGIGKTLMAKSLAKSIDGNFKRVQFTPDLLPSDITGFNMYDKKTGKFIFQSGPIFANILLADEINRTIPRTQSSLLESMGENQVSVDGLTMDLPKPFFVIATQNPIELEGTFPLPEAQLDRFLLRISIGYPTKEEEMIILDRFQGNNPLDELKNVAEPEDIIELQKKVREINISKPIKEYIINIVNSTRESKSLSLGVSPRGTINLMHASQALAVIRGRDFVLPDDVKSLVNPVLSHRIYLQSKERIKGIDKNKVLNDIVEKTPIPIGSGVNNE